MKIVKDNVKRQYELTVLIPAKLTEANISKFKDELKTKVFKKHKVEVLSQEDWGKKVLAYEIKYEGKTHIDAYYCHYVIEALPESVQKVKQALNIHPKVFRYLVVLSKQKQEVE